MRIQTQTQRTRTTLDMPLAVSTPLMRWARSIRRHLQDAFNNTSTAQPTTFTATPTPGSCHLTARTASTIGWGLLRVDFGLIESAIFLLRRKSMNLTTSRTILFSLLFSFPIIPAGFSLPTMPTTPTPPTDETYQADKGVAWSAKKVRVCSASPDRGPEPGAGGTGPAGAAAGGATAAASLAVNVAAGGVKNVTSSTGYLADKTTTQIVDQVSAYYAKQGWGGV